jgi:hypothetical protein
MTRIGEILVSLGACDADAIRKALRSQSIFGARLGTHLLRLGVVGEAQLAKALKQRHGVQSVSGDVPVDPKARALVPRHLVEKHEVIPYCLVERDLAVLAADPGDARALGEIAAATGKRVHPFVVPEARLWALMGKLYGIDRGLRGIDVAVLDRPAVAAGKPVAAPGQGPVAADLMTEEAFGALYQG